MKFVKIDTNFLFQNFSRGFTYYQINTLDSRITNIDQLLTQDVEKFCSSVADLYTNVSKVRETIDHVNITRICQILAILRYYNLCTKTVQFNRPKRSIVSGSLFSSLWTSFNSVRNRITFQQAKTFFL